MRIGLDMLAIQASGEPGRAEAAYARLLVSALLGRETDHEFILYGHDEHPRDAIPSSARATLVATNHGQTPGETTPSGRIEALIEANPDRLDWLMVLDPFAPAIGIGPPSRPLGGLKIAAVVADLTPFVLPERDLEGDAEAGRGYRALVRLRQYDAILTPSEVTRADAMALLGLAPDRVVAIGNAADRRAFAPEDSLPMPLASRRALHDLGIRRAFLLVDAGRPGQKNVERMIHVVRGLPDRLRLSYQVVFVGPVPDALIARAREAAAPAPCDSLLFTGAVSRVALRILLQHCAVFVHPALSDGFGPRILEAMLCGAVVVAGDNTVQAELLGDAGILADPSDPTAIADQVARVLDDWTLASKLRAAGPARARRFDIERAAANALAAIERIQTPRLRVDRPHRFRTKPRVACFSPLPPRISGIADYAVRLIDELKASYTIDLYHDAGYLPDLGLIAGDFATYDARLFERNHAVLNYRAIVYQMGNSLDYHGYLYDVSLRHPGVVTLHDFFLSVYPYRGTRGVADVLAAFRREIHHFCPDRADEFVPHLRDWCEEEGGLAAACGRRGLFLNRRVFENARAVVVHSPWCLEQVKAWMPEHAGRTSVIPMGATPTSRTAEERRAIRARFALPHDALVVASLGFIHPDKLIHEAMAAFGPVARDDESAWFVCVGDECDDGLARRQAEALGLSDRVRFLGRQPADAYADLIAVTDIGLALRRPPTNGETSAALLDLLAAGVATLVTDVATFADYPDAVVRKVRWGPGRRGPEELARALRTLAADPIDRAALGRAAQDHVRKRHAWKSSAALYAGLIDSCAAMQGRHVPGRPHSAVLAKEPS